MFKGCLKNKINDSAIVFLNLKTRIQAQFFNVIFMAENFFWVISYPKILLKVLLGLGSGTKFQSVLFKNKPKKFYLPNKKWHPNELSLIAGYNFFINLRSFTLK